jgi:hypothetical protein
VQPVFNLMAEQIGLMAEAGEQPALRLGYDDMNESACIKQVRGRRACMLACASPWRSAGASQPRALMCLLQ